jgi:hypothetical protein
MHRFRLVLCASLLAACSGRATPPSDDPAKPASVSLTAGSELAPISRERRAPTRARAATPADLDVRASAESPVGPMPSEQADALPIGLTVRNRSADAILLEAPHVSVDVYRAGRAVPGCDGAPVAIELPPVLAPSASVSAHASLPCALTEPGDYDVVTELVVGAGRDLEIASPADTRSSASTRVTVSGELGAHGGAIPPAPIYPPGHSGLVDPAPRDARP